MKTQPQTHTAASPSRKSDDYLSMRTGNELSPFYHSLMREAAYAKQFRRYMATTIGSEEANVERKKLMAMKSV